MFIIVEQFKLDKCGNFLIVSALMLQVGGRLFVCLFVCLWASNLIVDKKFLETLIQLKPGSAIASIDPIRQHQMKLHL